MANKNKVEFGLSNVHVAIEKGDGWDVPKHIPGAVTFTPSAESDDFHFYADDGDYYNESTDNGYSGELSMALLPDWFLGSVLGYKKLDDGGIVEIKNAPKKRFCLIFEGKGDKEKTRHMFINCGAGKPTEEFKTLEDKKEVRVQTMPITVSGDLESGVIKLKYRESDTGYSTLFTKIPDFKGGKDITVEESVW